VGLNKGTTIRLQEIYPKSRDFSGKTYPFSPHDQSNFRIECETLLIYWCFNVTKSLYNKNICSFENMLKVFLKTALKKL
jgi:hypothetical protein